MYEGEHLLLPVHQSGLHSLLIEIFHSLNCIMFQTSLLSCALSQCIVTIIPEAFSF